MKRDRQSRLARLGRVMIWAAAVIVANGAAQPVRPASPTAPAVSAAMVGSQSTPASVAAAICTRLIIERSPRRAELDRLYGSVLSAPIWVDATGRITPAAREALALLHHADEDGLDPRDYDAAGLARLAAAIDASPTLNCEDTAAFDVALSGALLSYFRHLHLGRVDPRTIGFRVRGPDDSHDFVALVQSAVLESRVAKTAADLRPALVQYRALRTALSRYRSLAAAGIGSPPLATVAIRPGDPYTGLDTLVRQLHALGDFPTEAALPSEPDVYDGAVVAAVKRFQIRHGLEPDGILGRGTQAALRVPLDWRVRQIELALERLRWLPDLGRQRLIVLNIPMFTLWAWDEITPAGGPALRMRAIVGRALDTQTPVFVDEMSHVIFRPFWNVPRSILRNEILPVMARDRGYLRRNDMEIVRGAGDDARVEADTPRARALLDQGLLRLRQRPGPRNSLGLVKFVFPNDDNVYMHGTPAQELFARSRRDFSHGCVRVEDPAALAAWLLKQEPGWNMERILAAMSGPGPQQVDLPSPVQVILFYITALVMPEDGAVHFVEDIYRHDARLDRALAALPAR